MKKLKVRDVKVLKIFHLIFVMMWVIGVATMALLCLLVPKSGDEFFMLLNISRFVDDILVIPGAIMTVVTAIVYGLATNWGFFKHKWIIVKWVFSIIIILIGTFYFSPLLDSTLISVDELRGASLHSPEISRNMQTIFLGGVCQGSLLVFLVVISVIKPWKEKK